MAVPSEDLVATSRFHPLKRKNISPNIPSKKNPSLFIKSIENSMSNVYMYAVSYILKMGCSVHPHWSLFKNKK